MNVAFLTDSDNALRIAEHIAETGDDVRVFRNAISLDMLASHGIDFVVSCGARSIVRPDVIDAFRGRIINMHISLLPWNRGADPNIWSFIDRTPKGVTIHEMDEGIDTGAIIVQQEVALDGRRQTLRSSYAMLHDVMFAMFVRTWQTIRAGGIAATAQRGTGSTHRKRELDPYRESIDFDIPADDVCAILRDRLGSDKVNNLWGGYASLLKAAFIYQIVASCAEAASLQHDDRRRALCGHS